MVSDKFKGVALLEQQRLVYKILDDELKTGNFIYRIECISLLTVLLFLASFFDCKKRCARAVDLYKNTRAMGEKQANT